MSHETSAKHQGAANRAANVGGNSGSPSTSGCVTPYAFPRNSPHGKPDILVRPSAEREAKNDDADDGPTGQAPAANLPAEDGQARAKQNGHHDCNGRCTPCGV